GGRGVRRRRNKPAAAATRRRHRSGDETRAGSGPAAPGNRPGDLQTGRYASQHFSRTERGRSPLEYGQGRGGVLAQEANVPARGMICYSTVTLLAKFRGLSTSQPRSTALWYASSCSGTAA